MLEQTQTDLLSEENYYSNESNKAYWSASQYKRFLECPKKAIAELSGDFVEEKDKTPLLVGNYVHSHFESLEAHDKFLKENADAIISKAGKTKGQPKKEYAVADRMIARLESDNQFKSYYVGEKEVSVSGQIKGVLFKGKIDCLNVESGYFVDIKTTAKPIDEAVWSDEFKTKVRWFEHFGYVRQMAIYRELLRQQYNKDFMPIIYAVTKEEFPDSRAIVFKNDANLTYELKEMELIIEELDDMKKGKTEASYCGKCNYCKQEMLSPRIEIY